ncbi:MAG: hypothetical protein RXQ99_09925 [Acidianus sp.]|uniref:hypothetical protein n=1 Tax=Acidianus sp. TaxID=1872104 RepID=UPI00397D4930
MTTDRKNRLEECTGLIEEAMKCLESNDKECVTRLIELLIKNQCHNGYAVSKEVADKVRELVHELWLVSSGDNEFRCGLLRMLKSLNVSKRWVRDALHTDAGALNTWFVRCSINWEGKVTRNDVVKIIEGLLREKFGWNEIKMCEELLRFIGVDVNAFRKYGIEPCNWLEGLESLSDLRRPYWFGLRTSDLAVRKGNRETELVLETTNAIDAVFFAKLLSTVKVPNLSIRWAKSAKKAKYIHKSINLEYYIDLNANVWPWPIKLSTSELEGILNSLSDEELAEFVAGVIDGDGFIWYNKYNNSKTAYVAIAACKDCPKRVVLDILKEVIAERFGIVGTIDHFETAYALVFGGEDAVKLLRRVVKYIHHPLRRLRVELILALYDGRISPEEFEELYKPTKYKRGEPDVKRNRGLDALVRAAPQTHTHGELRHKNSMARH